MFNLCCFAGKSHYAGNEELPMAARQLESIVKTVYGLIHPGFVAFLRSTSLSIAVAWNQEWAGDTGAVWCEMAGGCGIERLSDFVRGGVPTFL